MNQEDFDRKFAADLRRVAIPSDLHARLLEIPHQPVADPLAAMPRTRLATDLPQSKRVGRRRIWIGAASVAVVAAILWLGWALPGKRPPKELVGPAPLVASREANREANRESLAAAESPREADSREEIERMRGELRALERAYQALEQEELANLGDPRIAEPQVAIALPDAELRKAEAIFWAAETSLFSGMRTEAVREQLKYLVKEFPDSSPAKRATALLADF